MVGIGETEVVVTRKDRNARPKRHISQKPDKGPTYLILSQTEIDDKDCFISVKSSSKWKVDEKPLWANVISNEDGIDVGLPDENNSYDGYIRIINNDGKSAIIRVIKRKINHFEYIIDTVPITSVIRWKDGKIGKENIVETKDETYSLEYEISEKGYCTQTGTITCSVDSPRAVIKIELQRPSNVFTYELKTTPQSTVIWENGYVGSKVAIISEDKMAYVRYTATTEGYGCEEGVIYADVDAPNAVAERTLTKGGKMHYYALNTNPQDCDVLWSNGQTGKNTHILSHKDCQRLYYTAYTEGYVETMGYMETSDNNISVSKTIDLTRQ